MKNRLFWTVIALCLVGAPFVGRVGAQDEQDEGCGTGCACGEEMDEGCGEQEEAPAGGMPPWMQLTKEHKDFEKMAGHWDAVVDFTPMGMGKSNGSATTRVILDGRFVQQQFKGTAMGRPFEGLLHIGYDTVRKQYVSTWMDSGSPFLYVSRGTMKDGELTMTGKEPNPRGEGLVDSTTVTKWINDDQYTLTFYTTVDGQKVRTGVITYTRRK
jgi:hypothetical protein